MKAYGIPEQAVCDISDDPATVCDIVTHGFLNFSVYIMPTLKPAQASDTRSIF
jgi:hypothetical protein